MDGEQIGARETVEIGRRAVASIEDRRLHAGRNYNTRPDGICSTAMSTQTVRLHRWDEIALEKVTEMLSRKIVTGEREMIAQIYLKRGCIVPNHSHESEQMTYILQGALKFLIAGEEITVREGEVLHIPSWVEHQAEALDDTFELDVFSPIRQDWLDHTDDYFHR
jgi:quercetin dioxygenase-like cupin family protein